MSTDNRPIGVLDSGLGGISVLRELVKLMPGEDFIYYGDSANAPYGTRTWRRSSTDKKMWNFCWSGARESNRRPTAIQRQVWRSKRTEPHMRRFSPGDRDRTGVKTSDQGKGTFQSRRHGNPDDAVTDEI